MSTLLRARRRPRGRRLVADVLGAALLLGGGGLVAQRELQPQFRAAGRVPDAAPAAAAVERAPARAGAAGRPVRAWADHSFVPQRLVLPALGVQAAVVPVQVERGGGLAVPADARTVGWWAGGAAPGSPVGTVVLAGHVDAAGQGPGALARLAVAPVGARVTLGGAGTRSAYLVQARRRYAKARLPWRSLFAQGQRPRLVLVTCGGDFDSRTRHYTDNVVVVATPIAVS